jgi:hypothetical protein
MSVSLSAITGSAQVGLTSPTYTPTVDSPPVVNSKQWWVSALGGTQTGVSVHSASSPFTVAFFKPLVFKQLGPVNPVTGVLKDVPMNTYKMIVQKGMLPLAGQAFKTGRMTVLLDIPAGADLADYQSIRAMLSCGIGALSQVTSGLGDTLIQGTL